MRILLMMFSLGLISALPASKPTLWLIGDSTISIKETRAYPETGWGMPFAHFFDTTIRIENRAKNGRSTKSFREEGLWDAALPQIKEGDYVLIQFGHNDEGKEKVGRYTTPDEFEANLRRYVQETAERKAHPVLITPVSRRYFDSQGQVKETHPDYSGRVKKVAESLHVPLIDLDQKSRALYQQMGPDGSRLLFNHLQPGEHPNYPEGKKDDTHFNELGARLVAQLVLAELRAMHHPVTQYLAAPARK
jgi:lysophospholipase L1-like esterase